MTQPANPNDYIDPNTGGEQTTNSGGALGGLTQGLFGGPGLNGAAPTISQGGVGSALAQAQQGRALQGQAAGMASQLARGQGPSAVSQAYNQQVNNAQAAAHAMASSAAGPDQAMARRQAMMTAAQGQQAAGGAASLGHAQEQLGGMSTMGALAGQQRGQDLATGNLLGGLASNQAQLQEQQNQANLQAAEFQEKQNNSSLMSMAGMAAGALAFADAPHMPQGSGPTGTEMHLQEPPGPGAHNPLSHIILREEPFGLLIVNAVTGRMGKVPMVPLSPEEYQQALGPHGAGPIQNSMHAIQASDAHLSNLNDDPNQDQGSSPMQSFAQGASVFGGGGGGMGAMAAGDYRMGNRPHSLPHGVSPHVMSPHEVNLPQAVKTRHSGLYYGDADMSSPADQAKQADYDYQMSRADFGSMGPGGTSRETSMPSEQKDGRLFGKYSTPGTGVGGGDAPANSIDEDGNRYSAATGADPYAANPGKYNPATNPGAQDPTFGKVVAGALKGYANPQAPVQPQTSRTPQAGDVPAARLPALGVQNPGLKGPLTMGDGTTSGTDPSTTAAIDRGAQMLKQLDDQRMNGNALSPVHNPLELARVGEGNSMMGYNPEVLKLKLAGERAGIDQYNKTNDPKLLTKQDQAYYTNDHGEMSQPTTLPSHINKDVFDRTGKVMFQNTADEGWDRPDVATMYSSLPQGPALKAPLGEGGRETDVGSGVKVENNGQQVDMPVQKVTAHDFTFPKPSKLTQKFAERPKKRNKK